MRRTVVRALLLCAGGVVLLAGVVLYPFAHNRYVFPLGRLAGEIRRGDRCVEVERRFADYAARRRHAPELQLNRFTATKDLLRGDPVPPGRGLHLYDVSLFDDVQLSVRCDPSGRVAEMLFIGD